MGFCYPKPLPEDAYRTRPEIDAYLNAKLDDRIQLNHLCDTSEYDRQIVLDILRHAPNRASFFINNFGYTADPRKNPLTGKKNEEVPFLLFPAQEEAADFILKAIEDEEDAGVIKPRDLGLSWIALHVIALEAITTNGFKALVSSYHKDMNDSVGDIVELFAKLDFILRRLPDWLLPEGYDENDPNCKMKGTRKFPSMSSIISSRAPTSRFAVGDRLNVALLDDWGRWDFGYEAWQSARASTPCRIMIWTVNEDDPLNHAWEYHTGKLRFEGVDRNIFQMSIADDLRKRLLTTHPVTGTLVNAFTLGEIGDPKHGILGRSTLQTYQRAYLLDYESSVKGRIYGAQMPYVRIGPTPWIRELSFTTGTGTDFGVSDSHSIVWVQWDASKKRFRVTNCYSGSGHGGAFYAPIYKGLGRGKSVHNLTHYAEYDAKELELIELMTSRQVRVPGEADLTIPYEGHYGDPSGRKRNPSDGRSVQDVLSDHDINMVNNTKAVDHTSRIEAVRQGLLHTDFDEENCRELIDKLKTYKIGPNGTPVHDGYDLCNALAYYFVNTPHMEELTPDESMLDTDAAFEAAAILHNATKRAPLARRLSSQDEEAELEAFVRQHVFGRSGSGRSDVIFRDNDGGNSGGNSGDLW